MAGAAGLVHLALLLLAAPPLPELPLSCAVAEVDGGPVVDAAWLDDRVEQANAIFGPHGLRFRLVETRPLAAKHAELRNRADRHALGRLLRPGVINCFVVATLWDVHEEGVRRQGVHWRPATAPGKHLVIIAAYSSKRVLAHELGHFFGNREHPLVPGNLMGYLPGPGLPTLDDGQVARALRFARKFLKTGELRPRKATPSGGR